SLDLSSSATFTCQAASKQDLVLDQPPVVRALRGESVTLACSCDVCNYPDFHSEWRVTRGNGGPGTTLAVKTAISSKQLDPQYKFSLTHQRNSRSLLLIKNLQINDQGTYVCTMIKNVPPPTVILKGPGTQLEVYGNGHLAWARVSVVMELSWGPKSSSCETCPLRGSVCLAAQMRDERALGFVAHS
uniref:Ig-like domain-containing protein n=1 Tax=Chelydra serpentina TaxID=8475 RepID=A0A8C3S9V0_CHESE